MDLRRFRVLGFALGGAMLGGSLGFSFLLAQVLDFSPNPVALFKKNNGYRFLGMLTKDLMVFGLVWGAVQGTYLAWETLSQAKMGSAVVKYKNLSGYAGLVSVLFLSGFIWQTYYYFNFHVIRVSQRGWYFFLYQNYIYGVACFGFSGLGFALAKRPWLKVLFLIPTIATFIWISSSPYFP